MALELLCKYLYICIRLLKIGSYKKFKADTIIRHLIASAV